MLGFGSGFQVSRGGVGTGGGVERIFVSHKSGFLMTFISLSFPEMGYLELGFGGGYVQLEYSFFLSGSWFFLCKGFLRGREDFL